MRNPSRSAGSAYAEVGAALLAVLVVLLIVAGSSSSFIWYMNRLQTHAGQRYRSAAALAIAEAGVHRALSILETVSPDGKPGRQWRPTAYAEVTRLGLLEGRFTLSLADADDGAIVVNSDGYIGSVWRGLRARVYVASTAQLAALYAASIVRLENPTAAVVILPYPTRISDRPWIQVAAGAGVWLETAAVSINAPTSAFSRSGGPVDVINGVNATVPSRLGPIRLLLARGAELTVGRDPQQVDVQQLRAMGLLIDETILRPAAFPTPPEVHKVFYQTMAASNIKNAALNKAAGEHLGDAGLVLKHDALYSPAQFEQLQAYASDVGEPLRLHGVVYVTGGLSLIGRDGLHIVDGTLITEGTVNLDQGASLEIIHSAATRSLPGLLVLDDGAVVVAQKAHLRVHGLVYVNRLFKIGEGAYVDIVGSVLANDPELSFHNSGGSIVIRYDPAVLGTPGLHVPIDAPVIAWAAAWEELP